MSSKNNKENKIPEAAALKYNIEEDNAPNLVAKGTGELAKKIIAQAEENNIPIKEDEDIVQVLLKLELGADIPEELYQAVAEILSFIFEMEDLA
ncbi:EscU/YscU/HrcU family type III secretion system export apparatus switch protein [Halanaerobacter jeridensis]|uniref:Flagellar biosynthesis protein n=1 Tax=Halanaerobacter jeridensis TaxID=706427 RepID=A0A938XQ68_9FIRM|nr:EscU/YscU/HrcU family type III secretion system export apparatus switch protein [Halanaerobacter jeridensis]MBM7555524.1 flagellar biosynthesis protein [Halanaerobacter jeridensis]